MNTPAKEPGKTVAMPLPQSKCKPERTDQPLTEEDLLKKDVITPDDVLRLNRATTGNVRKSAKVIES